MIETEVLEQRVETLKQQVKRAEARLAKAEQALHQRRLLDLGWVGKTARSNRVPGGIVITDVRFKTWAPTEPQEAIGETRTIPVTSAGFQIHDTHPASPRS